MRSHAFFEPIVTKFFMWGRVGIVITDAKFYYARKHLLLSAVLVIAILSVRLSVTRVDQSKTEQARITKSSPSATRKTLVSETVKLFHKFEGSHPKRGR